MFFGDMKVLFMYYLVMKNNKQLVVRKVRIDEDFFVLDRKFYYLWCYGVVVV